MEDEVVKYAPKAVIDELDAISMEKLTLGEVLTDTEYDVGGIWYLTETHKWFGSFLSEERNEMQLEVAKHLMGEQRLQPERETRWYVDKEGGLIQLGIDEVPELLSGHQMLEYEFGMTEKQARGYAELFGGEPKEIK